jgi:hypothetical protein
MHRQLSAVSRQPGKAEWDHKTLRQWMRRCVGGEAFARTPPELWILGWQMLRPYFAVLAMTTSHFRTDKLEHFAFALTLFLHSRPSPYPSPCQGEGSTSAARAGEGNMCGKPN